VGKTAWAADDDEKRQVEKFQKNDDDLSLQLLSPPGPSLLHPRYIASGYNNNSRPLPSIVRREEGPVGIGQFIWHLPSHNNGAAWSVETKMNIFLTMTIYVSVSHNIRNLFTKTTKHQTTKASSKISILLS